jgi:hypothetical protein
MSRLLKRGGKSKTHTLLTHSVTQVSLIYCTNPPILCTPHYLTAGDPQFPIRQAHGSLSQRTRQATPPLHPHSRPDARPIFARPPRRTRYHLLRLGMLGAGGGGDPGHVYTGSTATITARWRAPASSSSHGTSR